MLLVILFSCLSKSDSSGTPVPVPVAPTNGSPIENTPDWVPEEAPLEVKLRLEVKCK